jgi:hypothetical protein
MIEVKAKGTGAESPLLPPVCQCYCYPVEPERPTVAMQVWGEAQGPGCYCWCDGVMEWGASEVAYW